MGLGLDFYVIVAGSLAVAFLVVFLGKRQERKAKAGK